MDAGLVWLTQHEVSEQYNCSVGQSKATWYCVLPNGHDDRQNLVSNPGAISFRASGLFNSFWIFVPLFKIIYSDFDRFFARQELRPVSQILHVSPKIVVSVVATSYMTIRIVLYTTFSVWDVPIMTSLSVNKYYLLVLIVSQIFLRYFYNPHAEMTHLEGWTVRCSIVRTFISRIWHLFVGRQM